MVFYFRSPGQKACMQFLSLPYLLHVLPMSSSSIWSPYKLWSLASLSEPWLSVFLAMLSFCKLQAKRENNANAKSISECLLPEMCCTFVRWFDTTVSVVQPFKLTVKRAVGQNTMSRDLACIGAVLHTVAVASFAYFIRKQSYCVITFTTCRIYIKLCKNIMLPEPSCLYRPTN